MPPAVLSVAIPAAASLGGAYLQGRGYGRAADAQLSANNAQLEFAREQEAAAQARYEDEQRRLDEAWAAEQQHRAPFRRASAGILSGYGFGGSSPSRGPAGASPTGVGSSARPAGWTPGGGSGGFGPSGSVTDFSGFGLGKPTGPSTGAAPPLRAPTPGSLGGFL